MKDLTLTLICLLALNFAALAQSNFDVGFKSGFNNGYCYSNQSSDYCSPPYAPYPPYPQTNESSDNYQDGYNRGFLYGQARRIKDESNSSSQRSVSSDPPKFNSYVSQSPILSLSPQERSAYYAARARQDQAAAEAFGNLLEHIFTVTPEGRARRADRKAGREALSSLRKEEREAKHWEEYKKRNKKKFKNTLASAEFDFKSLPVYSEITTDQIIPVYDIPDLVQGKCLANLVGTTITIIKKENDKYYLVKSGDVNGYVFVGFIMKNKK